MKYYQYFFSLFIFIVIINCTVKSQTSCQPTITTGVTSLTYDGVNSYNFKYSGPTDTITYNYSKIKGGTFKALTTKVGNNYTFSPSFGGVSAFLSNTTAYPWGSGVTFNLDSCYISGTLSLHTQWTMKYNNDTYIYFYDLTLSGRTLIIDISSPSTKGQYIHTLRCDKAGRAYALKIPYLTNATILFSHDTTFSQRKVFTSFFSDWAISDASGYSISDMSRKDSGAVSYGQTIRYTPKTNGTRNKIKERFYLTTSPDLSNVLPNIPNTPSPYKQASANKMAIDFWTDWRINNSTFLKVKNVMDTLKIKGLDSLWLTIHQWQRYGYDVKLPDVFPARDLLNGGPLGTGHEMDTLSASLVKNKVLLGLHENYVDFYKTAPSYNTANVGLKSDGTKIQCWVNTDTSYLMKPSKISIYSNSVQNNVKTNYHTSASYLDVHTSQNPSLITDQDANVANSGKYRETINYYKNLFSSTRNIYKGPVSGEGKNHMFYMGAIDDVEARNCLNCDSADAGYRKPMLVDFDLNKMHNLSAVHGMGYYHHFFGRQKETQPTPYVFSKDELRMYSASEIAFGHGAFWTTTDLTYSFYSSVENEYKYVMPLQKLYCMSTATSIKYNDNGNLVSASKFISDHPVTFSDYTKPDFMGQVTVQYSNGLTVYVNRHPTKSWSITVPANYSYINFHCTLGTDSLYAGNSVAYKNKTIILPAKTGWLAVYDNCFNSRPTITVSPGSPSICNGASVSLTASGAISYAWSPSTGLSATTGAVVVANPTVTKTYTITGTSATGCTNTKTITVIVNALPTITISPAAPSICLGTSVSLTAGGASTYAWSPGTGLNSTTGAIVVASPTTTKTYTITGTSNTGCANKKTVIVTVNPLPIITASPAAPTICAGTSVGLTAGGASTYVWSPGTGLSSTTGAIVIANPTITKTYTITGTSLAGCTNKKTVIVTVNPLPVITASPAAPSICIGASVNLTASGANTYAWSPGTGLSSTTGAIVTANPTLTKTYTITGTSSAGCTNKKTVIVTVNQLPNITVSPAAPYVFLGESINLVASGANTYTWSPDTSLSSSTGSVVIAYPIVETTYTITGTSAYGCINTTTKTVTVDYNDTYHGKYDGSPDSLNENTTEIVLYPNPTRNNLSITSNQSITTINIYNVLGELLKTDRVENTINTSLLSPGVYFAHCLINDKVVIRKFIKE